MIDRLLSITRPLSLKSFFLNTTLLFFFSAILMIVAWETLGKNNNGPLAIYCMIVVVSFATPTLGFLIARLVRTIRSSNTFD